MSKAFGTIFQIDNILVSEDIVKEYFSCDYEKCRGCCCVIGDSGAPLEEEEIPQIEKCYNIFSPLMTDEGREAVKKTGCFEIDRDGDTVTPVVHKRHKVELGYTVIGSDDLFGTSGYEDCAFIHYSKQNNGLSCFCSIEKCFFEEKSSFQKPISCRLYPIRVTKLTGGGLALNLHRWKICKDAFEKGKKEKIRVYQFLKNPLIDAYGKDFYEALCLEAERFNSRK